MADNENKKCSDGRTFLIAFLTAVIVVALYHLGMGLCREYCGSCKPEMCPPPMMNRCPMMPQGFILVPVQMMNEGNCPMMMRKMGREGGMRGVWNGGRHGRNGKAAGMHHGMKGHPQWPDEMDAPCMRGPKDPECGPCPGPKGPKDPEDKPGPGEAKPAPAK